MRYLTIMLACLALPGVASAQAVDPNLRRPAILLVEEDGIQTQFVVGDGAWGDMLGSLGSLRNASTTQPADIVTQLWDGRDEISPLFLFEVARLTVATDPDRAMEAYFLGRSRAIYDASRCVDSSAFPVVNAASEAAGEAVGALLRTDIARVEAALAGVIESGEAFTGQASPWWACSFGEAAFVAAENDAVLSGAQWLKAESVWPSLRETITASMNANLDAIRASAATRP